MEDEKIVELYIRRDELAIEETQTKYGRRLESISKRIVEDNGAAEECVNDTYLKTWNSIPPHEPRSYLYAFLVRITRGISLDHYRKTHAQKRNANMTVITDELDSCVKGSNTTLEMFDENIMQEAINSFLASLPKEKRIVFMKRYWYMMGISEIAMETGYSVSKIKVSLMRTRNKLKEHLEKEGLL